MQLITTFSRALMAGAAIIALAACSEAEAPDAPLSTPDAEPLADADLDSPAATASAAPPPQSCEKTSYCSGALVVRSDIMTLSRPRSKNIEVVGTLSFENRSASEIRVALLNENLVLNTTKGISADQGSVYTSGLGVCRRDGSECFDAEPDTFRLIAPGDSPAKLNIALRGNVADSLAPMVSQVETGTLTLMAYTVTAEGSRQVHRISLADIPISNQVAQ